MSNFDTAVGATEAALNSEGSAIEENNKRMDSLQGKLTQLDSAWQQFAKNTINSDVIKAIISLGTQLVKLADTNIGRLIIAVTSLKVATVAWNKVMNGKSLLQFVTSSDLVKKTILSMTTAFQVSSVSAGTFKSAMIAAGTGVEVLTKAIVSNPLLMGTLVVGTVLGVIDAVNKYNEAQRKTQEELAKTNQKEATELENLKNTYESLMDSKNRTAEDNNKLKDTIDTLSEKYGIERTQLENVTGERQKAIDKINEEIAARKQAAAVAQTQAVDFKGGEREALESGQGMTYSSATAGNWGQQVWAKLTQNLNEADAAFKATGNTVAEVQKKMESYISVQSRKNDLTENERNTLKKVTEDYTTLTQNIDTWREGYKQALSNLTEGVDITEQQANALYSFPDLSFILIIGIIIIFIECYILILAF